MEIIRDRYLNKLLDRKENGLVKVVTGIRRCGKSYLLFHLYKNKLLSMGVDMYKIILKMRKLIMSFWMKSR